MLDMTKNTYDIANNRVIIPNLLWFNICERLCFNNGEKLSIKTYFTKEIENENGGIDQYINRVCISQEGIECDI